MPLLSLELSLTVFLASSVLIMCYPNVLPEIQSAPWSKVDFPATLAVGESSVSCQVSIDQDGAIIHLKQGDVVLPREDWAFGTAGDSNLVLTVCGWGYSDWMKKLKAQKKSLDAEIPQVPGQAYHWQINFKPNKLGPETVAQIKQLVLRSDVENYLSSLDAADSVHLTRCPHCQAMIDVTPYADNENLFCNSCSQLLDKQRDTGESSYGICSGCSYYTKIKGNAQGLCHQCHARTMTRAFLSSLGVAALLLGINLFTIFAMDRFFPVLLLFGGVSLIWSLVKLTGVVMSSMARTAVGITSLEKSTALLQKGRADDALKLIESMPNATSNPGILLNLSRGLINAGNYEKANQFAELLVSEYPNFQLGYAVRLEAMSGAGASEAEIEEVGQELQAVICRNMVRSTTHLSQLSTAI